MNRTKLSILGLAAALPLAGSVLASAAGPNLVYHGDFTANMHGWVKFGGKDHAVQNDRLKVVNDYTGNGNSYYGVYQCVDNIDDKAKYTVSGDLWVDKNQSEYGSAGIYLHFYTGEDCDGTPLGGGHTSDGHTEARRGKWLELKHSVEAPDGANSVWVRLVAAKELAGSEPDDFVAFFDNIAMTEQKSLIAKPTATPKPDLPLANPTEDPDPDPDLPLANPTENPDPDPDLPLANPTENADPDPDLPLANPTGDGDAPGGNGNSEEPQGSGDDQPQNQPQEQPSNNGGNGGAPSNHGNGGNTGQDGPTEDAPTPGAPDTGDSAGANNSSDSILYGAIASFLGGVGIILAVLFRRSRREPQI